MKAADNVDVLLVEDVSYEAELAMRALRQTLVHHKLFWVRDGVEALEFLRGEAAFATRSALPIPKLILVDIKLPRLNGVEFVRELRADPTIGPAPIVMLTSSNQRTDILASYQAGASGFVTKPLDYTAFAEAVADLARFWLRLNEVV